MADRSPPGHRQGEKQGVQPGIVEAFAEVAAGRQEHPPCVLGNRCQASQSGAELLFAHSTPKHDEMVDFPG